ncbi:hypothetical protein [Photobacterium sp. GB-72]|uniref:hypothetical protein n=1 Tax=Photobacterium sp. GB-72 TaxID=2022105 RepID=UPI000D15401B|nr:hypothetical protein [Photobacterium sp. GB-72]PSV30324.1 hypothetical protein C9J40_13655 [Photobacterium sp. GB-72]
MKTIKFKTEVSLNINNEYRITINSQKVDYIQFPTKKALIAFSKANTNTPEMKRVYSRLRHRNTLKYYKGEYDMFILVTSGVHKGSFACVNSMEGLMTRLTDGKFTMTRGNKGNNVEGFGETFDKVRWTINKNYENFTKQSVEGKGKLNHFNQAKKMHEGSWKVRLAQFLATISEEELNEVMLERQHIIERKDSKAISNIIMESNQ